MWQARKQNSFANNMHITFMPLIITTVQIMLLHHTQCLQVLGRRAVHITVKVFDSLSWEDQRGYKFPPDKTSQPLMSAHTILGMYAAPPRSPLCDPVCTSLTLCEALHAWFPQRHKYSLANHILGQKKGALKNKVIGWFQMFMVNRLCDFIRDHNKR